MLAQSPQFLLCSLDPATVRPCQTNCDLRPATADEIAETLSFALRYDGRKRVHHADDAMARITADRLVRHLERAGFVLMKRPPPPPATNAGHVANS